MEEMLFWSPFLLNNNASILCLSKAGPSLCCLRYSCNLEL